MNSQLKMPPKIIIAGAPASGKGTQCEMIKERYGVVHLSTGEMLRQAASDGTEVGLKVGGRKLGVAAGWFGAMEGKERPRRRRYAFTCRRSDIEVGGS